MNVWDFVIRDCDVDPSRTCLKLGTYQQMIVSIYPLETQNNVKGLVSKALK